MGLRQFFGDSILKMVQEARDRQEYEAPTRGASIGERINEGNGMPALLVYRIANGYIAQSFVGHTYGNRQPPFHYCKDHQAIAEFVVAETARQALGLNPTPPSEGQYAEQQAMAKAKASRPQVMTKPNY